MTVGRYVGFPLKVGDIAVFNGLGARTGLDNLVAYTITRVYNNGYVDCKNVNMKTYVILPVSVLRKLTKLEIAMLIISSEQSEGE
jgi:hypothetical protein